MSRLNDMVYMQTKCLGSMFKFNGSVKCVTKNYPDSNPISVFRFNVPDLSGIL